MLVVEDDAMVAAVITTALTLAGYEVVHAADCNSAVELLAARPPKVMVVDVGLPDGNGLDLVRQARACAFPPTVIVLSGFRQEATVLRAFDAGADDFMSKPFSPRELVARVGRRSGG